MLFPSIHWLKSLSLFTANLFLLAIMLVCLSEKFITTGPWVDEMLVQDL